MISMWEIDIALSVFPVFAQEKKSYISSINHCHCCPSNCLLCPPNFRQTMTSSSVAQPINYSAFTSAAASSASIPTSKRDFMRIDLSDYENRQQEIIANLMKAATTDGFFYGTYLKFSE